MDKYKKLLFYSLATFVILFTINLIQVYVNINKYEENNIINRKGELQIIVTDMKKVSDSIYDNLINTKSVIDIFKKAHISTQTDKELIRDNLYSLLKSNYMTFTNYGIQQLHFHLPNNESFLRFHKPSKYGDNLTKIRESVRYVNETKKPTIGFEEGRIFNGYRFVYPLFDENEAHIGSVEVSSSLLSFKQLYESKKDIQIDYVLTKEEVEKKLFKDQLSNYSAYPLSDKFLIQTPLVDYNKKHKDEKKRDSILKNLSKEDSVIKKVNNLEEFHSFAFEEFQLYTVDFIPLLNDFTSKKVGYIIILYKSDYFDYMLNSHLMTLVIILFLSILVGYIFYIKNRQRDISKKQSLEYKAILDIYENMVLVVENSNIVEMNNKFLDFYQPKKSSKILSITDIIMCDDEFFNVNGTILEKFTNKSPMAMVVSITSEDSKTKFFNIFVHELLLDNSNKYIIELIDITEHKKKAEELEQKALTDKLTNVFNRYYFENVIEERFLKMKESNQSLSLIMFDIDYFKVINDSYGHIVGDESLKFLSKLVKENIRDDDVFCRWGGEEFILLVNNSLENSVKMSEHLRKKIEQETKSSEKIPDFTCSFGVVSLNQYKSTKEGLKEVDKLLYASKAEGRNRVSF